MQFCQQNFRSFFFFASFDEIDIGRPFRLLQKLTRPTLASAILSTRSWIREILSENCKKSFHLHFCAMRQSLIFEQFSITTHFTSDDKRCGRYKSRGVINYIVHYIDCYYIPVRSPPNPLYSFPKGVHCNDGLKEIYRLIIFGPLYLSSEPICRTCRT